MKQLAKDLGTNKISTLLLKQSIPTSIGILLVTLNIVIDTIIVGQWIGVLAIAATTVVLPISLLISSIGTGVGIGGSSIISRALGQKNNPKAFKTFGNQISLTILITILFVIFGILFNDEILSLFGAKGNILKPAKKYYNVIIWGIPFLTFAMMGNPVIRAEDKPKFSMFTFLIPAVVNIFLDIIFIKYLDLGIFGAGLATCIAYICPGLYVLIFFLSKKSDLKIILRNFTLDFIIVKEIFRLGSITLIKQASLSFLIIVLNYSLYKFGGEIYISVFGIIKNIMLFSFFPIVGISLGLMPIVGYNFGAKKYKRVKDTIYKSIIYSYLSAGIIYTFILIYPEQVAGLFTRDTSLLENIAKPIFYIFIVSPIVAVQLVATSYFQAIGKALPALFLTILKQTIVLTILLYVLPIYFGVDGVWYAFPISDILATIITWFILKKELNFYNY